MRIFLMLSLMSSNRRWMISALSVRRFPGKGHKQDRMHLEAVGAGSRYAS